MTTDILNLSWQIQVSLASGYAAYLLSYIGMRSAHRAVDIAFVTLIFGLVATAMIALFHSSTPIIAGGIAFILTCTVALAWRAWFRGWLHAALRAFDISWSNDDPSAFATIANNSKFPITQVGVELDDGTWLRCEEAHKFQDTPFGPLILGPNGDVALYLTHEEIKGTAARALKNVRHETYGDLITYVPAARIRQIVVRHQSKTSRSSRAVAARHSVSAKDPG